jgi:hypothetical protein
MEAVCAFVGYDGKRKVQCGVTAEALKRCDAHLPHTVSQVIGEITTPVRSYQSGRNKRWRATSLRIHAAIAAPLL